MSKKNVIQPEETALFRDAVGAVTPLRRGPRHALARATPVPQARHSEQDEREVMARLLDPPIDPSTLDTGDESEYRQNGVQLSILRRLRRGQYARQAELDLHGLTVPQARDRLIGFLARAQAGSLRCVRVIHGKGLRSKGRGPVLKPRVQAWLRQRQDVLAYCTATPAEGGSGALYVLLKRG